MVLVWSKPSSNERSLVQPVKGVGKLPVGKYRIHHWIIERKDEKDNTWKLKGHWFRDRGLFDVTESGQTELTVGEPVIYTLDVQKRGSRHYFDQKLKGNFEEQIEITRNGSRPQAPKLHIKSGDGEYDRTFNFEYG